MTEGDLMWVTPTYHLLHMHTPHIGATAVRVDIQANTTLPDGGAAVSATASRTDAGLAVTITNRSLSEEATVRLVANADLRTARGQLLTADHPAAANSVAEPNRVAPSTLDIAGAGADGWRIDLPRHSMATVRLRA